MKNGFEFASFDWGSYLQHRPRYLPALYSLVYDYHAQHSNSWHHAYDVGTGVGIVAAELLTRFSHVTATDASPEYIARARDFLTPSPERLTLAIHAGEAPFAAAPGSLDLITIATALHWMDGQAVLLRAHEALKPGGTLAVWNYRPGFIAESSAAVHAAWAAVFTRWMALLESRLGHSTPLQIDKSGYDNFAFDKELWVDVGRVKWLPSQPLEVDVQALPSRVAPEENVELRAAKDMFGMDVDFEWIRGYIYSLRPDVDPDVAFKEEFAALRTAMAEAGGTVKIAFPAVLILASKL